MVSKSIGGTHALKSAKITVIVRVNDRDGAASFFFFCEALAKNLITNVPKYVVKLCAQYVYCYIAGTWVVVPIARPRLTILLIS